MNIVGFAILSLVGSIVCSVAATALPYTREGGDEFKQGSTLRPEGEEDARNGITNKQELWPKGEVVYKFSSYWDQMPAVRDIFKNGFMRATDAVSSRTCIKFREAVGNEFHIEITPSNDKTKFEADVGRKGVGQGATKSEFTVGLDWPFLRAKGLLIHELLHSVGLWHEQQRADRDQYITVLPQNLDGNQDRNYEIKSDASALGLPYDYKSIMHSVPSTGARAGLKAFEPTANFVGTYIGQMEYLTSTDMQKVNALYEGIC